METLALCAFIRYDVIEFAREEVSTESSRRSAVTVLCSGELPLGTRLVNSRVRTLGLACAAVDTVTRDVDGHDDR